MSANHFEKQYISYAAHHNNRVNILIHLICVPLILWSGSVVSIYAFGAIITTSTVPVLRPVIDPLGGVTVALLWMLGNLIFYLTLEPIASTLLAPILLGIVYLANSFLHTNSSSLSVAVGVHIFSWVAQFIGHGVYEKRRPKLLDNVIQAFSLAPLFVWLEILFYFGYRHNFYKQLKVKVEMEVVRLKGGKVISELKSKTKL